MNCKLSKIYSALLVLYIAESLRGAEYEGHGAWLLVVGYIFYKYIEDKETQ